MTTIVSLSRADLSYALAAVIPHASKAVGLAAQTGEDGQMYLRTWATDRLTAGCVETPLHADADVEDAETALSIADAKELERAIRPGRVAERTVEVALAFAPGELHVRIGDKQAEVWDTTDPDRSLSSLDQWLVVFEALRCLVFPDFDAGLLSRFSKAAPNGEVARFYPYADSDQPDAVPHGALIAVGQRFIGSIAGIDHAISIEARPELTPPTELGVSA